MRATTVPRHQRGAALLVAMIMIFMLSLLGVSAMRNSTLEQQMTVNAILTNDVLHAAESASELVLNDTGNISTLLSAGAGNTLVIESPLGTDSRFASRATLTNVGAGKLSGFSITAAEDGASFQGQRFESRGEASIAEVRARRQVSQGLVRPLPK